jgi:hypothetical protein
MDSEGASPLPEPAIRVCPRCGTGADEQQYCHTCGLDLYAQPELPLRSEWTPASWRQPDRPRLGLRTPTDNSGSSGAADRNGPEARVSAHEDPERSLITAGWWFAFIFPIVGAIIGIMLMSRRRVGVGAGIVVLAIVVATIIGALIFDAADNDDSFRDPDGLYYEVP